MKMIPYGKQYIDKKDIDQVSKILKNLEISGMQLKVKLYLILNQLC